MAFENWNRLIRQCASCERTNKQPPPPQSKKDSKEVSKIEQKQIQKI